MTATTDDRFLRQPEVSRLTGLSRTTIWRLERRNLFPRRVQLTEYSVAWRASAVKEWMAERAALSGAAATAGRGATARAREPEPVLTE